MPQGRDLLVVFLDRMGVSDAIESLTDEEHDELLSVLPSRRKRGEWDMSRRAHVIAWEQRYFHNRLRFLTEEKARELPLDVIEFSDSAFLITNDAPTVVEIAIFMMHFCFHQRMPLRVGIASGSFARLAYSAQETANGSIVHHLPFQGTGIVRAYRAATCGIPGFRILVHPSAAAESIAFPFAPLPEPCADAVQEINYLIAETVSPVDYYHSVLDRMKPRQPFPRVIRHYVATAETLTRFVEEAIANKEFRLMPPVDPRAWSGDLNI